MVGDTLDDAAGGIGSAVVPAFGGMLVRFFAKGMRGEWQRQTSRALQVAEAISGMSREDLADWIDTDPVASPLFLHVIWAAGMNGHDETLAAMGAVFGEAARASHDADQDRLDEAELALVAMGALRPRHFRVLRAALAQKGEVVDGELRQPDTFAPTLATASGLSRETTTQCLWNLAAAGLVSTRDAYNGTMYPPTELGKAVARAATAYAAADAESSG